jgi:thiamine kinase-like enzyme
VGRHYAAVVKRLAALPRTLIHGEFYPCNVLIRTDARSVRVCPVDWEMAGSGSGLVDLAALTAGWTDRRQRALARAYLRGVSGQTDAERPLRIPRRFWVDLDCCRLHLAMKMLGWSDDWMPPPQHAYNWLAEAVRITDRLEL